MIFAKVSQEVIEKQSALMDARLALNYFPGIYLMSVAAWGVFQTVIGNYLMAPIATSLLLANFYFFTRIA